MAVKRRTTRPIGTRAAMYTRISRDAEGLALGVERQREDLEAFAVDRGLEIVARFEDNDIGASTRSRKPRPAYRQMLADAAAGSFDVVLAYTSSRLTRRPRENEDLIELAERHGVRFLYRNSPSFDLNTADGRNVARILAANDAAESERIGERVSRRAQQRAENGSWHGGWAPCGYSFTYDKSDPPKVTGLKVDTKRAKILQEMAQRIIDGETLYALCRDLNARWPFVPTPPGAKSHEGTIWWSRTLKRALINPAVIGMREYGGRWDASDGEPLELYDGNWPAIIDRDTWDRVRDVLLDPARTDPNQPWMADTNRKRALSGIMVCGAIRTEGPKRGQVCGTTLVSAPYKGQPSMVCATQVTGGCGHIRIAYEPVELWVTRLLVARLDGPAMKKALSRQDRDTSGEEAQLRREITVDEKRLRTLEDQLVDELLTPASYRRQRDRLTARIEHARGKLSAIVGQRTAAVDVANGQDLAARLAGASVERQRAILGTFIERVVIAPHPVGVPRNLSARRGETEQAHAARRADLRESVLAQRVKIEWRDLRT